MTCLYSISRSEGDLTKHSVLKGLKVRLRGSGLGWICSIAPGRKGNLGMRAEIQLTFCSTGLGPWHRATST